MIVNRYHGAEAISLKDIERTLGLKVYATLSNDYEAVITSVNSGKPLILEGNSKYAKDLSKLGSLISGLRPQKSRLRLTNPFRQIWQKVHHTNGKAVPADE